jgi:hypothetical protein
VFFLAENKFEIRISPDLIKMAETISNDKNSKSKTTASSEGRFNRSQDRFYSFEHFEHLVFGFVSSFEFRASDFRFIQVRYLKICAF